MKIKKRKSEREKRGKEKREKGKRKKMQRLDLLYWDDPPIVVVKTIKTTESGPEEKNGYRLKQCPVDEKDLVPVEEKLVDASFNRRRLVRAVKKVLAPRWFFSQGDPMRGDGGNGGGLLVVGMRACDGHRFLVVVDARQSMYHDPDEIVIDEDDEDEPEEEVDEPVAHCVDEPCEHYFTLKKETADDFNSSVPKNLNVSKIEKDEKDRKEYDAPDPLKRCNFETFEEFIMEPSGLEDRVDEDENDDGENSEPVVDEEMALCTKEEWEAKKKKKRDLAEAIGTDMVDSFCSSCFGVGNLSHRTQTDHWYQRIQKDLKDSKESKDSKGQVKKRDQQKQKFAVPEHPSSSSSSVTAQKPGEKRKHFSNDNLGNNSTDKGNESQNFGSEDDGKDEKDAKRTKLCEKESIDLENKDKSGKNEEKQGEKKEKEKENEKEDEKEKKGKRTRRGLISLELFDPLGSDRSDLARWLSEPRELNRDAPDELITRERTIMNWQRNLQSFETISWKPAGPGPLEVNARIWREIERRLRMSGRPYVTRTKNLPWFVEDRRSSDTLCNVFVAQRRVGDSYDKIVDNRRKQLEGHDPTDPPNFQSAHRYAKSLTS